MRVAPWMPDHFAFQQNYPGGQQAYEQSMHQTVQNWQNQQGGPKGPRLDPNTTSLGLAGLLGNIQQGGPPRQHHPNFTQGPADGPPRDIFGMLGFGKQLGGFGDQLTGLEETLGGYGKQFGGMEKTLGGFDKSITDITDRLSGIEEGIASLKTADNQYSNPYSRMYNPFSFLGYWGGRR